MSERESDDRVAEPRSPYGDQDEWGNSIDALKANLKLTPMERLERACQAAKSMEGLVRAARRLD